MFEPPNNFVGASAIVGTAATGLFLTLYIAQGLYQRPAHTKGVSGYVQFFAALSVFALAAWGYPTADFFRGSYDAWTLQNAVSGPPNVKTIWDFLLNTTLFRRYANEIAENNFSLIWSQAALTWKMGVSLWIASEGQQKQIPGYWAYVLLAQVFPSSLAQNLFYIALIIHPSWKADEARKEAEWREKKAKRARGEEVPPPDYRPSQTPNPTLVALTMNTLVYVAVLHCLPYYQTTSAFLPMVFLLRVLPLVPMFVNNKDAIEPSMIFVVAATCIPTSIRATALLSLKVPYEEIFKGIFRNPTTTAFGYDLLVGLLSVTLYTLFT